MAKKIKKEIKRFTIVDSSDLNKTYGNFKLYCKAKDLKYHSLKKNKFPMEINGATIYRAIHISGNTTNNESS